MRALLLYTTILNNSCCFLRPSICGIRTTCKVQAFVLRRDAHSKAWCCDGHTHTDPSKVLCSGRHSGGLYRTVQGAVDYSRDFFGRPAYLTVSGQMQGEFFATALSNVYTFGPTFRAEGGRQGVFVHSRSVRHGRHHFKTQSKSRSAGTCPPSCCSQQKASKSPAHT